MTISVDAAGVASRVPNREIITEWAEALESGKFQQGKSFLRTQDDKFCCLGVLCEIAVDHGVIDGPFNLAIGDYKREWRYDSNSAFLPSKVSNWAFGVSGGSVELITDDGLRESAIRMNDDLDYTFAEIAAAIRRTHLDS